MITELLQLVVLFLVIFDPPVSLGVFTYATQGMKAAKMRRIGILAVALAAGLSLLFLLFGVKVLGAFNTTIEDFRVAGGIVLALLGLNMVLGKSAQHMTEIKKGSAAGIAAIIATPLLTGPAAITAIILSVAEFGMLLTGSAVAFVLAITGVAFFYAQSIARVMGPTSIQVISTILGLVTLSWGIDFIRTGVGL